MNTRARIATLHGLLRMGVTASKIDLAAGEGRETAG
jgi:hypothetical protein